MHWGLLQHPRREKPLSAWCSCGHRQSTCRQPHLPASRQSSTRALLKRAVGKQPPPKEAQQELWAGKVSLEKLLARERLLELSAPPQARLPCTDCGSEEQRLHGLCCLHAGPLGSPDQKLHFLCCAHAGALGGPEEQQNLPLAAAWQEAWLLCSFSAAAVSLLIKLPHTGTPLA